MSSRPLQRVLMTADAVGGVWTFALELAEGLTSLGADVFLAVLGGRPSAAQRAQATRIKNLKLFESEFKLEWMPDPWRDVEASTRWLLALERRLAPDVVHLNSFGNAAAPWMSPVVLTAHSCVRSWWRAVHGAAPPAEWDRYGRLVAGALGSADVVTAPSAFMLRALEENYGPVPYGRVIWNGRNPAGFAPSAKEPFILSAGRLWDLGKNLESLAEASGRLEWPVYLAGASEAPDGGTKEFAGCRMLGQVTAADLREWYARASIYALPARYEPFGLSALEAALSECALALADIPSLREIWEGAAVFVPPGDPREWSAALQRLIAADEDRKSLGLLARERALRLTTERMTAEYAACYEEAAAAKEASCVS